MEEYIGKSIIIGITFLDKDEKIIEYYQTSGIIKVIENGILNIEREESIFHLPFDIDTLKAAEPGVYTEKGTGRKIIDPDYKTEWTVKKSDSKTIEEYKKTGFGF